MICSDIISVVYFDRHRLKILTHRVEWYICSKISNFNVNFVIVHSLVEFSIWMN